MKEEKDSELYSAVIPFLKKYPSAFDKKQRLLLVEKLAKEIPATPYFDFISWAKEKLK